jgi:flagellar P-ring protein precursor FlgI
VPNRAILIAALTGLFAVPAFAQEAPPEMVAAAKGAKPPVVTAPKPAPAAPASPGPAGVTAKQAPVSVLREALPPRGPLQPVVRIKDIARVESVRSNQLVGYGIVTGLAGTGDSQQSPFTIQSVVASLQRFGIAPPVASTKLKNAAAVLITAEIPAFAKNGTKLDVTVSSIGDATSIQGGVLAQTPLLGADDKVYAVTQGSVSIGGFSAGAGGSGTVKNHPTTGRAPAAAIVEREIKTTLTAPDGSLKINLNYPDFENATKVAGAICERLGEGSAVAEDSASIRVLPKPGENPVTLIAQIEDLRVQPTMQAKVVLNERTGTVIIGGAVRIAPVAVSHGALTVEIQTDFEVSQPEPLSKKGETVVVPQTGVKVDEQKAALVELQPGTSLADLVRALNSLRVTPRDIVAIIQAIKDAGGLYAELELQ